ncbi:hypothetical protein Dimus_016528 [Dionaea muscipula]
MEAAAEPEVITDKTQMRNWSRAMRAKGKTIGLVPTMGFLHKGHRFLISKAHEHAHLVVVSIYVNPGQFSTSEDLSTYPSDFLGDVRKIMSVPGGAAVVFHPHNLYDYGAAGGGGGGGGEERPVRGEKLVSSVEEREGGHETWVRVEKLEKGLCGNSRPVFFRGVATVVSKLFNIVEPDVAIFGKKDYQQWRIIQRMVRDLDFPVQIIGAEIVRDDDGLAMSSRNVYLSPEERKKVHSVPCLSLIPWFRNSTICYCPKNSLKRKLKLIIPIFCILQALSINRSLSKAKTDAEEEGQLNCKELKSLVADAIQQAGGTVDYAEVNAECGFSLYLELLVWL